MRYKAGLALLVLVVLIIGGCARFPSSGGNVPQSTISFDITVADKINPNKYYFVAIDTDQIGGTGPVPVVAPPWGNGWGAESISYYAVYQPGGFGFYHILPDTDLLMKESMGYPFEASIINNRTVHIVLDLDKLKPPDGKKLERLDVNFITTDAVLLDPDYGGIKAVDALSSYITIPVTSSRTYSNSGQDGMNLAVQEGAHDMQVEDPSLDIVDWKIEVRIAK